MICLIVIAVVLLIFIGRTRGARWDPSMAWLKQALCVHRHEARWNDPDPPYYGGMQFHISTWQRAGGSGFPHQATPHEQLYRAWVIWRMDKGSWREWPTFARYCG